MLWGHSGVPIPALRPRCRPGVVQTAVFLLSVPSSAAELPPPVSVDPEPGTFPQEPPLDTLPGELATF